MCELREATQLGLKKAREETGKVLCSAVIAQPLLPLLALHAGLISWLTHSGLASGLAPPLI